MGFWSITPNITLWDSIKSIWSQTSPPKLFETRDMVTPVIPNIIFKKATFQNAALYSEFLSKYFETGDVVSDVPLQVMSDGFLKGDWIGVEAVSGGETLLGLIISKPVADFFSSEFPETPLRNIGLVDYFCVAPEIRSKGVGTALLTHLHHTTRTEGRVGHIFASDSGNLFSRIPMFFQDIYIWREKNHESLRFALEIQRNYIFSESFVKEILGKNGTGGKSFVAVNYGVPTDISYYTYNGRDFQIHILIKPTYEKKSGKNVGEILAAWTSGVNGDYIDIILDSIRDYDIFIAIHDVLPQSKSWKRGAPIGFYPFHFHPGAFDINNFLLLV